ncbi:Uncharacterised protein [uncultured archaeon]|nr:Uncharacterised protein [uncultured archaeon]
MSESLLIRSSAILHVSISCCCVASGFFASAFSILMNASRVFGSPSLPRCLMRSNLTSCLAVTYMSLKPLCFLSSSTSAGFLIESTTQFTSPFSFCSAFFASTPAPCSFLSSLPFAIRPSRVISFFSAASSSRITSESEKYLKPLVTRYSASVPLPAQFSPVRPIIIMQSFRSLFLIL